MPYPGTKEGDVPGVEKVRGKGVSEGGRVPEEIYQIIKHQQFAAN